MDPLSITTGVIGVVTFAAQSCQVTYNCIASLVGAPKAIESSKNLLIGTERSLTLLREIIPRGRPESETSRALQVALQKFRLQSTVQSTQILCDQFRATIQRITRHSTNARFSKRDRIVATLRDMDIKKFNEQLGQCQETISLAVNSINLLVTSQASLTRTSI